MYILLPTIEKTYNEDTKQIIRKEGTLKVNVDTSFQAHLKWEEQFADTLKCDLLTYTERVKKITKDKEQAKAQFLSLLKWLYCYIDSDDLPTFKDFCKLFDYEIADKILSKIGSVLEEVGNFASKN